MSYDKLMQKVAEVAPRHHEFLLKTAAEVKTSPYKEEITSELDGLMKKAFEMPGWAGGMGKSMASGAGMVGGAVAAGIAYALAGDMYDAAKRGITKSRNYQAMMSQNPDLKEMPAKNVQQAFSVLHHFNPEFSSNPIVAGSWVRRQATYGEDVLGNTQELGQLISSRKNLSDSKKLPAVPKFDTQEGRRSSEKHKMDMQRGQAELNRSGIMGPLELERLQNSIATDQEGRNIRFNQYNMQSEKHPYEMDKLKEELQRRHAPKP